MPLMDDNKKDAAQSLLEKSGVAAGQIFRHYKGGLYGVVATAIDEGTLEPVVVYRSNAHGTIWVRPLCSFTGVVTSSGPCGDVTTWRFTREQD